MTELISYPDKPKKLVPGFFLEELATNGRSDHLAILLLDSSTGHAMMLSLDYDHRTASLEDGHDVGGDLRGHSLLDLQSAGIDLDQPGQLADANYILAGDVGDMDAPIEREHVMLAHGIELDLPEHNHLVASAICECGFEYILCTHLIAAVHLIERTPHSCGSVLQAFALRVFSYMQKNGPYRRFNAL